MAVLILVAMLALGGYSLSYLMSTEARAVQNRGRQLQARMAAESAVEYVKAYLLDQKLQGLLGTAALDDPTTFEPMPLSFTSVVDAETPYFVCIAPDESGVSLSQLRYGITDEAARPNLNVLATEWYADTTTASNGSQDGEDQASEDGQETAEGERPENPLLYLEQLDPTVADAILDWLDPDDEPRTDGAEADYYQGLNPPYRPRNGRIASIGELLLVRGVTPRVLFGEDADFDGVLDWNENDGGTTYPFDDGDGILDRGLYGFVTLYTTEPNVDAYGESRIDLNQDDLEALYDAIADEFDEELARFIVAYRLFGPAGGGAGAPQGGTEPSDGQPDEEPVGEDRPAGESGDDEQQTEIREIAGLDASSGPRVRIESIADLIDAEVEATLAERGPDGQPRTERLESPLTSESLETILPVIIDRTTPRADQKRFEGLINVNTASREALLMIPGMTESIADLILTGRPSGAELGGSAAEQGMAWLLSSGVLTPEEFRRYERYLTGRSFVYRVQAIGFFAGEATQARVEAVVDVSGPVPRVLWWLDLTRTGRGVDARSLAETGILAAR